MSDTPDLYLADAIYTPTDEEVLTALLNSAQHAPMETHSRLTGECSECPWPLYALGPDEIANAILTSDWLTAHDARIRAEAQAEALEEAADATYLHTVIGQDNERTESQRPVLSADVRAWLRDRAAAIRGGKS